MEHLLSNSTFQFLITTAVSLLLGGMSVWLAMRRPVQIPLTYETLVQKRVDPSNEEVKDLLKAIHIAPDDSRVQYLHFVTFKLHNSGKESIITLTDAKPLCIAFKCGATILACEEIEGVPQDLDYTCQLEDEKILLAFPLLDPKDGVTLRVLIAGSIDLFPDISVRVPGTKRIVRANNIRQSKETFIMGILFLCAAISLLVSTGSPSSVPLPGGIWLILFAGVLLIVASWSDRKSRPSPHMLFSETLWDFVKTLPILIPFGIVAALIFYWFGGEALRYVFVIVMCLLTVFGLWWMPFIGITWFLKRMKMTYHPIFVGIRCSIPSLAFLGLCVQVFLEPFLYK